MESDIFNGLIVKDLENIDDTDDLIYLPSADENSSDNEFITDQEFSALLKKRESELLQEQQQLNADNIETPKEDTNVYEEIDKILNESDPAKTDVNQNKERESEVAATQELSFEPICLDDDSNSNSQEIAMSQDTEATQRYEYQEEEIPDVEMSTTIETTMALEAGEEAEEELFETIEFHTAENSPESQTISPEPAEIPQQNGESENPPEIPTFQEKELDIKKEKSEPPVPNDEIQAEDFDITGLDDIIDNLSGGNDSNDSVDSDKTVLFDMDYKNDELQTDESDGKKDEVKRELDEKRNENENLEEKSGENNEEIKEIEERAGENEVEMGELNENDGEIKENEEEMAKEIEICENNNEKNEEGKGEEEIERIQEETETPEKENEEKTQEAENEREEDKETLETEDKEKSEETEKDPPDTAVENKDCPEIPASEVKIDEKPVENELMKELNETFLDEHSYFTSQSIDLTSDDSSNSELFNEIKGKISDENEVVNPVISKFSKMLLESFERSTMDKSLLKFLKNFASTHKEEEEDIGQFKIVEEESREATVIVDSEIIDLDQMEFADNEDIKKEPVIQDIKKEVEESIPDISMKLEIDSEKIQEAMEIETCLNESEQMQVDPTVEETEKTDETEEESEVAEKSPGSDAVSDTFEFSEEVTIETAYEPQTCEPPDQFDVESPEFELFEGLGGESQRVEEQSSDSRKELGEFEEPAEIQEEPKESEEKSGESAEKSNESGTGDPEIEGEPKEPSNEEPRSNKPEETSEEKTKLVKVRVFGEQLLEEVKKTDEKLAEPEEVNVDDFIKDSFKKFRELLIEMNLKKYKKRDIEKIKNALMASGSESSNSEEETEATESDDDYVLNLDREFQNKNSEPSTPVVVSSTKEDANSPEAAEDKTPEETSNEVASKRKPPESEEESEAGEESETDSSDMDKEIDRLIDFTKLDKIPTEKQYVYAGKSKPKKKKKDKIKDILDDTLREDPSSSESEKDEEMTEEQYLRQINDNIKASLLKSSSESEIESDLDDLDDEEELNEESSDTDSLFMKKLHELDKDDEKKVKSRGKEIYEQDDDDYEDDERVMAEIDSTENKEDDEDQIGGKKSEEEKETEKNGEKEPENEKDQEIQMDQDNERDLETSKDQEPKNDQDKDQENEKNLEKDGETSGESSKDPEPEKSKKVAPKVDAVERQLFSKKLLEDSDDETTEKEPKEKTARKAGEKRAAGSKDDGSDSSDLEVLDISMFEKKRTYKGTSMEEYFSKKDPLTGQNQPSTSSASSAKPTPPEDEAIFLSSDSEDESVSSATPSASSSATLNKKRGPRSLLTTEQLAEETKKAQKDEDGRVRRLDAKIELLSQVMSQSEELLTQEDSTLILDFDKKRQKPITVHPELVKLLKEHQVEGVKFMYDTVFGSVNDLPKFQGSGCILAHCMGLGKTLQLITLLHTLIRYPQLLVYRVLVICPKSTVMNWKDEIYKWLSHIKTGPKLKVFFFRDNDDVSGKVRTLEEWYRSNKHRAGCLLLGYEAFKTMVGFDGSTKKQQPLPEAKIDSLKDSIEKCLLDGPDLVVCDEGHIIKNSKSQINVAVSKIQTKRRIVLTGTPIQNNLNEYFCMVNFVKPSFLGTEKEFNNLYANPIKSGQHKDSTKQAIKFMKQRSYVLNKKLSKFVQRKEAAILKEFLPEKYEYCLFIPLTNVQERLYEHFLKHNPLSAIHGGKSLLPDYTFLRKIWTHPKVLENAWIKAKIQHQKMRKLLVYDSDNDEGDEIYDTQGGDLSVMNDWWRQHIDPTDLESILPSNKLIVMFEILRMCQERQEKCLIFSAFVTVLNVVEFFMRQISEQESNDNAAAFGLNKFKGPWVPGRDYLRLDGKTSKTKRHEMVQMFNNQSDKRMRCFLISSKAGGQGINLFGANRCIILDTSWNPASDQQNIFRIYRLGQPRRCFVYRLLAMGTMEEKVYSRSVTKQAMSFRVVDKQQVDRHYNMAELSELYTLTKPDFLQRPTPQMPQDDILRRLLFMYPQKIYKYHEHDSLLENKLDEELSEEEKREAWKSYENDEQQTKRNTMYSSVYSHIQDITNPLLNDLGFGFSQMQSPFPQLLPPFNYPNYGANFDQSLFSSLYRPQTSGMYSGRSILPDLVGPNNYDLTYLSNLVQAATPTSSISSSSTTNQLLRNQLNNQHPLGNLGFPSLSPSTSLPQSPLPPIPVSPSSNMSGGGIIGLPRIRTDLMPPSQLPSTTSSSFRPIVTPAASTSSSASARPDALTNFGINDSIATLVPRSEPPTNFGINSNPSSSSSSSGFRKEVPPNAFHPANNPLLQNPNFVTPDQFSSKGRNSGDFSKDSRSTVNSTTKSSNSVPSKTSQSSHGHQNPSVSYQTIPTSHGISSSSNQHKSPASTTISSNNKNSMRHPANISVKTPRTINSLVPSPVNPRNSIYAPSTSGGIHNSNNKNNSNNHNQKMPVQSPKQQVKIHPLAGKMPGRPPGSSPMNVVPKKSVIVHPGAPQARGGIITQNRSSGIVISNVSSGSGSSGGPNQNARVQQPTQQPKKPGNPTQLPPKRVVISSSSLPKVGSNLNITTVAGNKIGLANTTLSNRPQIKVTTMPSSKQGMPGNVSQLGKQNLAPKTVISNSPSAAVQKITEMAKAGGIQFIKRVAGTNPGTSGVITTSSTSLPKLVARTVQAKPASSIDINRLAKNSAITISAVKESNNLTVPQLPGTSGLALKRAMENSMLSVIPAKKAKVMPGLQQRPRPPGPAANSGQPLEMIEID